MESPTWDFISFSAFQSVATISVAILTLILLFYKHSYTYWSRKNVVTVPPTIPFGNFGPYILQRTSFWEHAVDLYNELKKMKKRYGGVYMFTSPNLMLLDPELIKSIMSKDFQYFDSRGTYCDETHDPLMASLLNLNGMEWKNMRSKLTPTFSSGKIKMMFQILVACSEKLGDVLDQYVETGVGIDIKNLLGRYSIDIISSCAFGLECNSLKNPDNEFRKHGRRIFEQTFTDALRVLLANQCPKLHNWLGFKNIPKETNDFFFNLVKDTVDYRKNNNYARKDFMQLLVQLKDNGSLHNDVKDPSSMNLTLNQVAAQAFAFFVAGFESSSSTMSSVIYELARHSDVQEKVREEINRCLERYSGKMTYEGIMEMTYMDKVIDESMRLHAIAPMLMRECTSAEYRIPNSDLVLKKGMKVFIPITGLHLDPEYYPDPTKFDPDRFTYEEKIKRHQYTFLPFGGGPRNCIGLRFALMQMKVGLSALLPNYKFTLNPKTRLPLMADPKCILYSVLGSIWVDAEKIK